MADSSESACIIGIFEAKLRLAVPAPSLALAFLYRRLCAEMQSAMGMANAATAAWSSFVFAIDAAIFSSIERQWQKS